VRVRAEQTRYGVPAIARRPAGQDPLEPVGNAPGLRLSHGVRPRAFHRERVAPAHPAWARV